MLSGELRSIIKTEDILSFLQYIKQGHLVAYQERRLVIRNYWQLSNYFNDILYYLDEVFPTNNIY